STNTVPNPFHRGYINSFNFTIEQEYKGFVLQAGYVGARDTRPLVNMNLNASAPGTGQAGGLISQALGKTYTGTINGLVPFQGSSYDSLQTKVTRRFSNGSTLGVVWTWSKTLNYEDNEELASLAFPYPAYWSKNHSYAAYDRPQNVEIYGVLMLPFGQGRHWVNSGVGSRILGGWQINPVISLMSGVPFTVAANSSPLNANGSSQTANLVGPYNVINGAPLPTGQSCGATVLSCHYFDPAAFAVPAAATYGNTTRNQFRGPGYVNMNISLARRFKLTERFAFEIRADAMSFTNTPHLNAPNATVGAANFGVITSTLKPPGQGFFGNDPGNRTVWLGARLTF
ncbi:MAG: TonB-dependent receptor, partial [Terriglobales bacterium]